MSQNTITLYSDYVCPFCYLGRQSLDAFRSQRDAPLEIDWKPFDLRAQKRGPDGEINHDIDDGKDEAYFDQVRENVKRLREEYGAAEMRTLDEIPEQVDSLNAQVASFAVQQNAPDKWPDFDDAIFHALWVDGRDIGEEAVLVDLAEDVGIDGDTIRSALRDEDLRASLHERFEAARREGITGVPTFAYDGHAARGAVPPRHLERLVDGV